MKCDLIFTLLQQVESGMIDGRKPELRWQKAIQWGCNWPQVLKEFFETRISIDMMIMLKQVA